MIYLRCLILFVSVLSGTARRSVRISDFHSDAQQQNNASVQILESSVGMQEKSFWPAVHALGRASTAGVLVAGRPQQRPQPRAPYGKALSMWYRRPGVVPPVRAGLRRATVALSAASGPGEAGRAVESDWDRKSEANNELPEGDAKVDEVEEILPWLKEVQANTRKKLADMPSYDFGRKQQLRYMLNLLDKELELEMRIARMPADSNVDELVENAQGQAAVPRWFVKTETFCQPFSVVKPHLEAHREWVAEMRAAGTVITSGYRVDNEGRPGGGGLMFFQAADYAEAELLVRRDPLVVNGCVDWTLNEWIAEVGGLELT